MVVVDKVVAVVKGVDVSVRVVVGVGLLAGETQAKAMQRGPQARSLEQGLPKGRLAHIIPITLPYRVEKLPLRLRVVRKQEAVRQHDFLVVPAQIAAAAAATVGRKQPVLKLHVKGRVKTHRTKGRMGKDRHPL